MTTIIYTNSSSRLSYINTRSYKAMIIYECSSKFLDCPPPKTFIFSQFFFRFRTGRPELGYSAHLLGRSTVVVETVGKGKKLLQTHKVNFTFQSYQWYMLTVSYVHNRMKSSQLCCYINSQLLLTADVTLPNTDDVSLLLLLQLLLFCCCFSYCCFVVASVFVVLLLVFLVALLLSTVPCFSP